jgi:hypothetical protein
MHRRETIIAVIVAVAFTLITSVAYSQECRERNLSRKPAHIPTGKFCKVSDDEMTCFTLEEYKKLIEVDSKLDTELQKAVEKDQIITNQGLILRQKDVLIETMEKDKDVLVDQANRLGEKWRSCLDEQKGIPWDAMFWGIGAGALTGIIVGVVAYMTLAMPERSP